MPLARCLVASLFAASCLVIHSEPAARWWKGNLHTHSFWSDGDDFPEMIVNWYKSKGYNFLALSDHNVLSQGQKWLELITNRPIAALALSKYQKKFGGLWVEQRQQNGRSSVRLKPLGEFRHLFEEPGRFLLVQSEEITDKFGAAPIHLNASNIRDYIPPQGGSNVLDVMQRNVSAVLNQRKQTGQPMIPHLNHPNFGWGITAEDLMRVQGERFFEIYNGHPTVYDPGDATHASTERMWDIILTWRLAFLNMEPIFGLAVDDSHHYHEQSPSKSNSGRGWIMVRSRFLTPEHIIDSLERGDFYASSGVVLKDIHVSPKQLSLAIAADPGVRYRTQFIGTRRSFNSKSEPVQNEKGEALPVTHRYSPEVGQILAEIKGPRPQYTLQGDELYVRAKVISSKPKSNAVHKNETEAAWTQPLLIGVAAAGRN